ncbi:MAG: CoA pyrophosphatase [Sulfolobaceae archaeon]
MEECDAAVVLVINNEGRILIIKRKERNNDPWSGHMALPGGRRQKDEDCKQTAIRETKEEVGISPIIIKELGIYSPRSFSELKVKAFLGYYNGNDININEDEVEKAFWISPDELIEDKERMLYKNYIIWGMTYRILKDFLKSDRQQLYHLFSAVAHSSSEE